MKQRIWELDFLRGVLMAGVFVSHFLYDLVYMFGLMRLPQAVWNVLDPVFTWGAALFFVISGICVRFSSHSARRGLIVIAGGVLISAVTVGMYHLGMADKGVIIYFGVLHSIGTCMLLWPCFKKLPAGWALALGLFIAGAGLYVERHPVVNTWWLLPLGFYPAGFVSSDYFPILPNLGYFLIGTALNRWLYPTRQSLLPRVNSRQPLIRGFSFLGRHSLWFYLLHQPVIAGLIYLYTLL